MTSSRRRSGCRRQRLGQVGVLVANVVDPRRDRVDLQAPVRQRPDQLQRAIEVDARIKPCRLGLGPSRITGMRSCTKRTSRLAAVVMIEHDVIGSSASFGVAVVHRPANANNSPSGRR